MLCQTCNRRCDCPRHIHMGEARVQVPLNTRELEHLLGQGTNDDLYPLYLKLQRALEILKGSS